MNISKWVRRLRQICNRFLLNEIFIKQAETTMVSDEMESAARNFYFI